MTEPSLSYAGRQDVGRRENQQDAFQIYEFPEKSHIVCLLADGMGGHVAGEVAANCAINRFVSEMKDLTQPVYQSFDRLLDQANRAITKEIRANPDYQGMGCTLVALEIIGSEYRWISIGDSPLFLLKNGRLYRENADHSMASRLDAAARAGEITWEEAKASPNRQALLYALTGEAISRIDWQREAKQLASGDWLILASDGLETLSDNEIVSIIEANKKQDTNHVSDALIAAVKEKGHPHQDNTTVIVVKFDGLNQVRQDNDEITTRPIRNNGF